MVLINMNDNNNNDNQESTDEWLPFLAKNKIKFIKMKFKSVL